MSEVSVVGMATITMKISRTSIVGFSKGKTYKTRKSFRMYSVQKESFVKDGLWKILRTFAR